MYRPLKAAMSFLRSKKETIKFCLEILTGFSTVISSVIVILTLHEMQIQRNNAYMPDIIFETTTVTISWGNPENLDNYKSLVGADTDLNPSSINIPVKNIGVGVAKKISFTMDTDNYLSLLNLSNEINPENQYTYTQKDSRLTISNGLQEFNFTASFRDDKTFLLPDAEETYNFVIPFQYVSLLREIFLTLRASPNDIPDLQIQVFFEDVQGVKYNKTIILSPEPIFAVEDSDGNGLAIYQIAMK